MENNNNRRALRLPEFWVTDPVTWFAHVEAYFELENLTSQQHRYFNVVKSLSQDSLRLIKDILANPHPTMPYDILKERLLNNHGLTDFQKIERQFNRQSLEVGFWSVPVPLEVWRGGPHLHEALLVAGKLVPRGRINAVAPGRLVHIVDETSQRRFLF
jgi:hypothetical protein